MIVETLTRAELASELGYTDLEGNPSERAIAQLMRDAMGRWGMCPKRVVLEHAREQLRAGGVVTDTVPRVLKRLVALGECEEVAVGHEAYVVPCEPRWIASGEGRLAVLLGPVVLPAETPPLSGPDASDVVVRVHLEQDDQGAALEAHGVRQISLAEWLKPFAFLHHASRRADDAVRGDLVSLATFWERLVEAVSAEGLQLDSGAEVRAVAGKPGDFFGRHTAATLEGRWQVGVPDGVWCAYRRGHGEGHWLPTLISVDGDERRAFDLFDDDEWRWALFARSRAVGPEEIAQRTGDELQVTWPLPAQIRAALDIIGVPTGRWRWRVPSDSPDLWSLFN